MQTSSDTHTNTNKLVNQLLHLFCSSIKFIAFLLFQLELILHLPRTCRYCCNLCKVFSHILQSNSDIFLYIARYVLMYCKVYSDIFLYIARYVLIYCKVYSDKFLCIARYVLIYKNYFSDKSEPGSEATVPQKAILKLLEGQGRLALGDRF